MKLNLKEVTIEGLMFEDLMKIIDVASTVGFSCITVKDSRSCRASQLKDLE